MTKKLTFLLVTLFILSCENETVEIIEQHQKLTLKKVNYPGIDARIDCPGRFADFDSQGRLIKVSYECDGQTGSIRTYTYSDSGFIKSYGEGGSFDYDENDILIRANFSTDFGWGTTDFFYNDNIMLAQGYYRGVKNHFYTTYEFESDTREKLISIKIFDTSNNEEIISRETYRYNGNNPVEILIEQKYPDDLKLESKKNITITYDDKINPFKLGIPKNAYLAKSFNLAYQVPSYNIAFKADNNIESITINNLENNVTYTNTNSYSYNSDNYPIEAIYHLKGEPFRKEIFEYYE